MKSKIDHSDTIVIAELRARLKQDFLIYLYRVG